MNVAAGPELAAAVTNAGGLGIIGGVGYTTKILRQQVSQACSSIQHAPTLSGYLRVVGYIRHDAHDFVV